MLSPLTGAYPLAFIVVPLLPADPVDNKTTGRPENHLRAPARSRAASARRPSVMPAEPQKEPYFLDRGEHAGDDAGRDDQQNPEAVWREGVDERNQADPDAHADEQAHARRRGGSAVRLALEGPEWVASASEGVGGVDERAG